ncbi:MAG: type VII toxin-antitoxin system HepT family RNase toxin [bacterium]
MMRDWVIRKLKGYFSEREDILLAFLFGSYAKGKFISESDVDVAVQLREGYNLSDIKRIWRELEELLGIDIDLIALNRASPTIAWAALRGIPLFIGDRRWYLEYILEVSQEAEDMREFILDLWRWRSMAQGGEAMAPISRDRAESIIRRIAFIEVELGDLEKYKDLDFETYSADRKTRRDVERIEENVVNAAIDIAKILLAGERVEMPDTYRGVMNKLGEAGIVEGELAERISDLTRIRNILAHQYLDLKWDLVENFIAEGTDVFRDFLRIVKEKLATEGYGLSHRGGCF